MVAFTKEQAEAKLQELEKQHAKAFESNDIELLLSHYHPDATLVHKGVKTYYGLDEIKQALKPFLELSDNKTEPIKPLYASASIDGQYLIRRGTFSVQSKDFPLEHIYKKVGDKYLIYHDEFEFSQ